MKKDDFLKEDEDNLNVFLLMVCFVFTFVMIMGGAGSLYLLKQIYDYLIGV